MEKVLKITFVAVIALVAGINVYNSRKSVMLSDIAKENVEALANGEEVGSGQPCIVGKYDRRGPEVTMCGSPCVIQRCLGDREGICGFDIYVLAKE